MKNIILISLIAFNAKLEAQAITLSGHKGKINQVILSTDGKLAVTASSDNTVGLWDVENRKLVRILAGHTDIVTSVAISPDGKLIASGSNDKTIRLWNCQNGDYLRTIYGNESWVKSVVFTNDGTQILSCCDNNKLYIFDVLTGKFIKNYIGDPSYNATSIAISNPSKYIVAGSPHNTLQIWETEKENTSRVISGANSISEAAVSFASNGIHIGLGEQDDGVAVIDASSGLKVKSFSVEDGQKSRYYSTITSVCFSPDNKYIASGNSDLSFRIWDMETGKVIKFRIGNSAVMCPIKISFSPNGKYLATANENYDVELYDLLDLKISATAIPDGYGASDSIPKSNSPNEKYMLSIKNQLTYKSAILYNIKINNIDYSEFNFLNSCLRYFDHDNFNNYAPNEFQLNNKITVFRNNLKSELLNIKFTDVYTSIRKCTFGKYDFNSFKFQITPLKSQYEYTGPPNGAINYERIDQISYPYILATNSDDFSDFEMKMDIAERFLSQRTQNGVVDRDVFVKIYYSLVDLPQNHEGRINTIYCYVYKMEIWDDKCAKYNLLSIMNTKTMPPAYLLNTKLNFDSLYQNGHFNIPTPTNDSINNKVQEDDNGILSKFHATAWQLVETINPCGETILAKHKTIILFGSNGKVNGHDDDPIIRSERNVNGKIWTSSSTNAAWIYSYKIYKNGEIDLIEPLEPLESEDIKYFEFLFLDNDYLQLTGNGKDGIYVTKYRPITGP